MSMTPGKHTNAGAGSPSFPWMRRAPSKATGWSPRLPRHPRSFEGGDSRPYAEVAPQLGMNEEAVRKAVQRLRRRYREAIREEIAQTVATTAEVEEKRRYLVSVLSS